MNRRGVALPAALLGLLVAGALAALVLAAARLRWLAGRRQVASIQASIGAAGQAERARFDWNPLRSGLPPGTTVALPGLGSAPGPLTSHDSVSRLGRTLFLVRSVAARGAADGSLLARADLRLLVRLTAPPAPDSAALVSRLPGSVGPGARVSGLDQVPAGWDSVCPPPVGPGPALVVDTSPLLPAGEPGLAEWASWADRRAGGVTTGVGPSLTGGQCDLSPSANWGDPGGGPCSTFFPIIAADPGARLVDGTGQGLLLGLGSLELAGNFSFTGVILALGHVRVGDHAGVYGVVRSDSTAWVGDSAVVQRSTCAVERALMGAARPIRAVERGWWRAP